MIRTRNRMKLRMMTTTADEEDAVGFGFTPVFWTIFSLGFSAARLSGSAKNKMPAANATSVIEEDLLEPNLPKLAWTSATFAATSSFLHWSHAHTSFIFFSAASSSSSSSSTLTSATLRFARWTVLRFHACSHLFMESQSHCFAWAGRRPFFTIQSSSLIVWMLTDKRRSRTRARIDAKSLSTPQLLTQPQHKMTWTTRTARCRVVGFLSERVLASGTSRRARQKERRRCRKAVVRSTMHLLQPSQLLCPQ